MSIRNLRSEKRQPKLSPHTRLALSVISRAVTDIKEHDASLHRSAARFLNGSEEFYFWANVLELELLLVMKPVRLEKQTAPVT